MHHLSALDALFLQLETAEVPAHVGSVSLLKKPAGHRGSFYPRIRKHIESRLHLAPLFSRRLAFMPLDLANPIWLGGARVDLDHHIDHLFDNQRRIILRPACMCERSAIAQALPQLVADVGCQRRQEPQVVLEDRPRHRGGLAEGVSTDHQLAHRRVHLVE